MSHSLFLSWRLRQAGLTIATFVRSDYFGRMALATLLYRRTGGSDRRTGADFRAIILKQ